MWVVNKVLSGWEVFDDLGSYVVFRDKCDATIVAEYFNKNNINGKTFTDFDSVFKDLNVIPLSQMKGFEMNAVSRGYNDYLGGARISYGVELYGENLDDSRDWQFGYLAAMIDLQNKELFRLSRLVTAIACKMNINEDEL